jgi:hypothetical protein
VIANRYGDCKDVTTLMSALLAAKGVASEYALINTSPVYQLDATPQVASFNRVILYLPEFDLYADPTVAVSFVATCHAQIAASQSWGFRNIKSRWRRRRLVPPKNTPHASRAV